MRYLAYFSHGDHLGTCYMNTTFCCMVRHGIFKGSYENKHESVFWFGTQSCRVFFTQFFLLQSHLKEFLSSICIMVHCSEASSSSAAFHLPWEVCPTFVFIYEITSSCILLLMLAGFDTYNAYIFPF